MRNVVELALSWIVTTGLTFAIVLLDERWMAEEALERAWPPTSRDAAIVAFGPIVLLRHFIWTRGGFRTWQRFFLGIPLGFIMGVVSLLVVSLVGTVVVNVLMMALGYPVNFRLED
jgi:hypothetical protein